MSSRQSSAIFSISNLKATSLVNKTFSPRSTQSLFEGICVRVAPPYLDRLQRIASHPPLSHCVRMLHIDFGRTKWEYFSFEKWESAIDLRSTFEHYCCEGGLNPLDQHSKASYDAIPRLDCDQSKLKEEYERHSVVKAEHCMAFYVEVMIEAFSYLPNLSNLASLKSSGRLGGRAAVCDPFKMHIKEWVRTVPSP